LITENTGLHAQVGYRLLTFSNSYMHKEYMFKH